MTDHPITPPIELLKYWESQHFDYGENVDFLLIQAYQAGADQELEECCKLFESNSVCGTKFQRSSSVRDLRNKRRPQPKKVSMTVSITGTEEELQSLFEKLSHDKEVSIQFR